MRTANQAMSELPSADDWVGRYNSISARKWQRPIGKFSIANCLNDFEICWCVWKRCREPTSRRPPYPRGLGKHHHCGHGRSSSIRVHRRLPPAAPIGSECYSARVRARSLTPRASAFPLKQHTEVDSGDLVGSLYKTSRETYPKEDRPMWPYLQMWFPLFTATLGVSICFGVAAFVMSHGKPHP